jgi:hypothetical protein
MYEQLDRLRTLRDRLAGILPRIAGGAMSRTTIRRAGEPKRTARHRLLTRRDRHAGAA